MSDPAPSPSSTAGAPAVALPGPSIASTLLRVAWMSIALGLVLEGIVLAIGTFHDRKSAVADLLQKVSWSTIVCAGLAVGTTASRMRSAAMGLLGLLSAPAAFVVARILNKSATHTAALYASVGPDEPVLALVLLKAAEYAALGAFLGWVQRRPWGGLRTHVYAGVATGVLFGGGILFWTARSNPSLADAAFAAQAVNEFFYPVGCALILFTAHALGRRLHQG